ncbi:hypothetical protein TKK_0011723 [Trichogramma kaykai]|uniref:Spt6 SH2 domain-containing protein n=1 Tax=Trichogramma kaykai TaxID=54128 RepID=A0ABD2WQ81_9HYME
MASPTNSYKEVSESFYAGKILQGIVVGISYGKRCEPNEAKLVIGTNKCQCPCCLQQHFAASWDVYRHIEDGSCYERKVSVIIRLGGGVSGHIDRKNLEIQTDLEKRLKRGERIKCIGVRIDPERCSVECTQKNGVKVATEKLSVKTVSMQDKFKNMSYGDAEMLLTSMEPGDVIARCASNGGLSITWKVHQNTFKNLSLHEENSQFFIEKLAFKNIDEIIARFINPKATFVGDLTQRDFFIDHVCGSKSSVELCLVNMLENNHYYRHPYIVSLSKQHPTFVLSFIFLGENVCRHENIEISTEGFLFHSQIFKDVMQLIYSVQSC